MDEPRRSQAHPAKRVDSVPTATMERHHHAVSTQLLMHQGPLPPATDFAAYNKVLPGSADRILKMAEREQRAAIRLRRLDWTSQFISMLLGKSFLYVLVGATVFLIVKGKPIEALLTGVAPIASIIYSTFFGDRKVKGKEKQADQDR